jgi:hypothetical protein
VQVLENEAVVAKALRNNSGHQFVVTIRMDSQILRMLQQQQFSGYMDIATDDFESNMMSELSSKHA